MARDNKTPEKKTGVAAWNESAGISSRAQASNQSRHNRAVAEKRRRVASLVALLVVCVACVVCMWPITEQISRGLWLKEGTAYTFAVTQEDGSAPTTEQLSGAVSAIQGRLAASGVSEYAVSSRDGGTIVVDLPNMEDGEGLAKLVGGAGKVEFVRLDEVGDADALLKINAGTEGVSMGKDTYTSFLDGSSVSSSSVVDSGAGSHAVHIVFTDEGAQKFAEVTKELAEEMGRIAIVIDGRVTSAPSVSQAIDGGEVYISGDFSKEEANALKAALDSETIPLTFTYEGSEHMSHLLSKKVLYGYVILVVIGCVAVAAFSYTQFRNLSFILFGATLVYAILILGLMAVFSRANMFVLTIPGVLGGTWAGATTIMATWLVVSRFSAKASEGKSIRGAATSAPREALSSLGLPCAVVFVIACALLFVPMPALRDFGLSVILGTVSGLGAVFWFAVTSLRVLAAGTIQKNPASWGVKAVAEAGSTDEAAS